MANEFSELEKIAGEATGAEDAVLASAEAALQAQHDQKITGVYHTTDVDVVKTNYTVTIQPKEGEAKSATSDKSYADALAQATDSGKVEYDKANVKLSLEREVSIPYFVVKTSEAKSGNQRDLQKMLADDEQRLAERYGDAMVSKPEDTNFKCDVYAKGTFKQIVKRIAQSITGEPVATGTGATLQEAIAKASENQDSRSRLYSGQSTYKVFGREQGKAPSVRTGGTGAVFTPEYEAQTALY